MNHRTCGRAVLTNLGEMQVVAVTGWHFAAAAELQLIIIIKYNLRWRSTTVSNARRDLQYEMSVCVCVCVCVSTCRVCAVDGETN